MQWYSNGFALKLITKHIPLVLFFALKCIVKLVIPTKVSIPNEYIHEARHINVLFSYLYTQFKKCFFIQNSNLCTTKKLYFNRF